MPTPSSRDSAGDTSLALEQYKLAVDMADRLGGRRQSANAFFLSVVSALTVVGGLEIVSEQFWRYVVSVITMIVCFMWWWMLDSYRSIAEAKFKVIHEIERALPFAMFADEEQHYKSSKRYKPLSRIEQAVPMLFLAVNLVGAVAAAVIT